MALVLSLLPKPAYSQITSDGTLSTKITTTNGLNFTIDDGNRAGNNLFHSFSEFSVPSGGSATFNNSVGIENIIGRVTGGLVSDVNGLIRANGSANLFLINPNGIIFGSEASLELGGSFIGTTANSLQFEDGAEFSTTEPQLPPLLTINTPLGLQYGSNPGSIVNQSRATDINGNIVGLQVPPGQTLALVGGDIALEGGSLSAEVGRIEIGSVAANSRVKLIPRRNSYVLDYEGTENFQDIQVSQQSLVNTSGEGGGDIQLQGRRVNLTEASRIRADNLGDGEKGSLIVNASESVQLFSSGLFARNGGAGDGGELTISTKQLRLEDGAQISTATFGEGVGGSLTVNATESVILKGFSVDTNSLRNFGFLPFDNLILSGLFAITAAQGNAGNLTINTQQLIVEGRANLNVTSFGTGEGGELIINTQQLLVDGGSQVSAGTALNEQRGGDGGNLIVNATESVQLIGSADNGNNRIFPSGLFAQTLGEQNAGDLTITTGELTIRNGAQVTVASFGSGTAGDLIITADSVDLQNEARITVASLGSGQAGELKLKSGSVLLDNSQITAQTLSLSEDGGNIKLNVDDLLLLLNNSQISTAAGTPQAGGDGGNIAIDTDLIVAISQEDSNINANAFNGQGGNITINAQGIFGIEFREDLTSLSDITASSNTNLDGEVEINTPDVDPSQVIVELPSAIVDSTKLIANSCLAPSSGQKGNFIITGAGGLPTLPDDLSNSPFPTYSVPSELENEVSSSQHVLIGGTNSDTRKLENPLIEAEGIYRLADGRAVLGWECP
ncbi:MAG: S-layer family protein [Symploca sp. SIO3C6]|nr:S-layer family protein [Symploca sp. SIO3C6]